MNQAWRSSAPRTVKLMITAARWLVVAVATVVVASPPVLLHTLPARDSSISAVALAKQIRGSTRLGWSGEVRSLGSLAVPLSGSTFGGVTRLLGERSELRMWWRDAEHWRVDRIRASGEEDLTRDNRLTVRWSYESGRATFTPYSPVRLPNDADAVPASLAARLLAGARSDELSRLPARRIAGRSATGLRLEPADGRSTVARVDIWADQASGLPMRVDAYADGSPHRPVLSTELVSLTVGRPAASDTAIELSHGIRFRRAAALDEAAGANAFAPFVPPDMIAGLPRRGRPESFGAVGVYGRGPTAVLAIPLRDSAAHGLRDQLSKSHNARTQDGAAVSIGYRSGSASVRPRRSIALEVGPLSVLLVSGDRGNFLLTGTVTAATLRGAATDLLRGVVRTP